MWISDERTVNVLLWSPLAHTWGTNMCKHYCTCMIHNTTLHTKEKKKSTDYKVFTNPKKVKVKIRMMITHEYASS